MVTVMLKRSYFYDSLVVFSNLSKFISDITFGVRAISKASSMSYSIYKMMKTDHQPTQGLCTISLDYIYSSHSYNIFVCFCFLCISWGSLDWKLIAENLLLDFYHSLNLSHLSLYLTGTLVQFLVPQLFLTLCLLFIEIDLHLNFSDATQQLITGLIFYWQ